MPRNMKDDWWFKFEHLKWLTDEQLNRCSLQTQGFWIRCICIMRKSGTGMVSGTGPELCRLLSVTPSELRHCFGELLKTKAADVTVRHASVTHKSAIFTIMSRKVCREFKVKEQNRLRKQKERRHALVTTKSRPHNKSKSKKKEDISKEISKEPPYPPKGGVRYGYAENGRPEELPKHVTKETNTWLDAIAPLTGAKSRQTMATAKRWREVVEKIVIEQRDLISFLAVVKNELERNKDTPHFFTPESCLKALQAGTVVRREAPNEPTLDEVIAEREAGKRIGKRPSEIETIQ